MLNNYYVKPILTFIILSTIFLSACAPLSTSVHQHEPLRIEFADWFGDYTLIVAKELGLFEKYGVDVEVIYYPNFGKVLPDLSAGLLDGGLVAVGDAVAISEHTPVKIVAVYDYGGISTVVASPEIDSISQLKGKRIALPLSSPYEIFVLEMLNTAGLDFSDVTVINAYPEEIPGNIPSQFDAAFSWQPFTTQALAEGNHILFSSENITGLFPDVIVFREAVTKQRPDDIRAFLKAWFEAAEYRRNNPVESQAIIAAYLNVPLETIERESEVELLDLPANLAIFENGVPGVYRSIEESTTINGQFLIRIGTLTQMPDLIQFLDSTFLQ